MDALDTQLADLIEQAIEECEAIAARADEHGPDWLHESAQEAVQAMRGQLQSVRAGSLLRPSGGAGLGFSRGLGEWAQDQERLMKLAYEIDEFYSVSCNSERKNT